MKEEIKDPDRARLIEFWKYREEKQPNFIGQIELITIVPPNSVDFNNRATVKYELGQYSEAIKGYTQAISLNPRAACCFYNRGNSKYKLGQYEDAIKDYSEAIKIDQNESVFFRKRGNSKYKLSQYEEAIKDYEEAIQLKPDDELIRLLLNKAKEALIKPNTNDSETVDFRKKL